MHEKNNEHQEYSIEVLKGNRPFLLVISGDIPILDSKFHILDEMRLKLASIVPWGSSVGKYTSSSN